MSFQIYLLSRMQQTEMYPPNSLPLKAVFLISALGRLQGKLLIGVIIVVLKGL